MAQFVYVTALKGPSPQVWHTAQTSSGKAKPTLAAHDLTDEQALLSLDQLVKLFPPPPKEENDDPPSPAQG